MFLPLLQVSDGNSSVSSDNMGELKIIIDGLESLGIPLELHVILILLVLFFSLKGIANFYSNYYKVVVKQYFIKVLRYRLIDLLVVFSFKDFISYDAGTIQNNLGSEVSKVSAGYLNYFACIQNGIMVIVYVFFAVLVDWKFAILTSLGGILTNLVYRSIYANTKKESKLIIKSNATFQSYLIQFVNNFKYLKATGVIFPYAVKMKDGIREIEDKNKKIGVFDIKISSSREPMLIAIVALVIMFQVYILSGSLASVMISLLFFYRALNSLMNVQANYNKFLSVSGSLDNIYEFEQTLRNGRETNGKIELTSFNNDIELNNVSFSFDNHAYVLENINLTIKKNKTVAFVGESGSGKTTLINIICGLLKPSTGSLSIDGIKAEKLDIVSYQNKIGYISQEPVIFNDSLFNNITLWDSYTKETIQKFNEAIIGASLKSFYDDLRNKENTLLGNNGINLSGGQKQRISIARELYKNTKLLILDEATSALDSENEKAIQDNIESIKGSFTIIIVAHRLSTIKNADEIFVFDKGELLSSGTFHELMENSNKFKKMVELQEIK